jgi:hypothetical protein
MSMISLGFLIYYLLAHDQVLTRYPMFCSLNALQLCTLGSVYAFGYFSPTIYLI